MRATSSAGMILGLMLVVGFLLVGSAAYGLVGHGYLQVPGAAPPYHLQIGVLYAVRVENVSATEVGDPLPATIPVWVKSSYFGNSTHTATRINQWDYEFTYTPPAISVGDAFDACGTAIVSYGNGPDGGYDARDPQCEPSWYCEAYGWPPGQLQFVNASGAEIACQPTGVGNAPWSFVKKLYR